MIRSRTALFAGALALTLLAAACSDDDKGTAKPQAAASEAPSAAKDIVDTAVGAGNFTTLASALQAAGLVETLKGAGPFTVFAPTDDAFKKVDAAVLEKLLKPENKDALTAVLTYHVVAGKVMAADVKAGDVKTVQGDAIAITTDGGVKLNGSATVTTTDIGASNGVIHVIDSVILPPSLDLATLK